MSQIDLAAERAQLLARMEEQRRQLAEQPGRTPAPSAPDTTLQVGRTARALVVGLVAVSGWPRFLKMPARAATSVWLRDRIAGLVRSGVTFPRQKLRRETMESTSNPPIGTPLNATGAEATRSRRGGARQLLEDLDTTLRESGHEDIEVLKTRLRAQLEDAREALNEAGGSANEIVRASVDCTEQYVRSHPWQAVGWAASAAFLLGVIVGRR